MLLGCFRWLRLAFSFSGAMLARALRFFFWRAPLVGASFFFLARRGRCLRVGSAARFFSGARRGRFAYFASVPRFLSGRVGPLLALFFGALCVLRALRVRCLVLRARWLRFCGFAFSLRFSGGAEGRPPPRGARVAFFCARFIAPGAGVFFSVAGALLARSVSFCVGVRRGRSFFLRAVVFAFFGLCFFGRAFWGAGLFCGWVCSARVFGAPIVGLVRLMFLWFFLWVFSCGGAWFVRFR